MYKAIKLYDMTGVFNDYNFRGKIYDLLICQRLLKHCATDLAEGPIDATLLANRAAVDSISKKVMTTLTTLKSSP